MRARYRKFRHHEKAFERKHRVWAFFYQFGGVLVAEYAAIQTVAVPIWGG